MGQSVRGGVPRHADSGRKLAKQIRVRLVGRKPFGTVQENRRQRRRCHIFRRVAVLRHAAVQGGGGRAAEGRLRDGEGRLREAGEGGSRHGDTRLQTAVLVPLEVFPGGRRRQRRNGV